MVRRRTQILGLHVIDLAGQVGSEQVRDDLVGSPRLSAVTNISSILVRAITNEPNTAM